jgi:hypothetical protein
MRAGWLVAAGVVVVLFSVAFAQSIDVGGRAELRDRFVVTEKEAFGLMAPELVAGPAVKEAHWSPIGRYILVEQYTQRQTTTGRVPGEIRLILWDRRAQRTDVLWKGPATGGYVDAVNWLVTGEVAFVSVTEPIPGGPSVNGEPAMRRKLLRVLASAGTMRPILEATQSDGFDVNVSPTQPLAVLERTSLAEPIAPGAPRTVATRAYQVLRANGTLGPPTASFAKQGVYVSIQWSQDGSVPYLVTIARDEDKKMRRTAYGLNLNTGQTTLLPQEPKYYSHRQVEEAKVEGIPLRLREAKTVIKEGGVSRTVRPLWLETVQPSEHPLAMVNADTSWSQLSPKGDGVLYSSQGAAWMAPVVRISRTAYDDLTKKALMSDARQVGLGIRMYVQDYDEKYPLPDHFSGGAVGPYIKNESIFEGFRYVFPGDMESSIENPAETMMGYITGPGGRAVVYVDGHVVWEPYER